MEIIFNDALNQMNCSFTDTDTLYICITFDIAFLFCVWVCLYTSIPDILCDPCPIIQEQCLQPSQPCSWGQQ